MSPPRHGIIRAETDTWQPTRFQLKRARDQTPPFALQVFLHTELHISFNISSSHGALTTKLPEQHRSPRYLPGSQHQTPPALVALTDTVEEGFKVVIVYTKLQEELLIFDSFFFIVLLSFPLYFFLVSGHSYLKSD